MLIEKIPSISGKAYIFRHSFNESEIEISNIVRKCPSFKFVNTYIFNARDYFMYNFMVYLHDVSKYIHDPSIVYIPVGSSNIVVNNIDTLLDKIIFRMDANCEDKTLEPFMDTLAIEYICMYIKYKM